MVNDRPVKYDGLQVLRGIAATMVVIYHTCRLNGVGPGHLHFFNGAAGADIFFVISGVIMALTAPRLTVSDFLRKRLVRIAPLYWLFLTAKLGIVLAAGGSAAARVPMNLSYLLSSYLFVPALDHDGQAFPLIVVGWTLNLEVYFYGVCAITLFLARRWFAPIAALLVLCASLAGLALHLAAEHPIAYLLDPIGLEFAGGLLLAGMIGPLSARISRQAALLVLAVAAITLIAVPSQLPYASLRVLWWGIPATVIVFAVIMLERHIEFVKWPRAILVGDASYSIYLAHTLVIPILGAIAIHFHLSQYLYVPVIIICSVIAGVIVHKVVERPLLRLLRRRGARAIPA